MEGVAFSAIYIVSSCRTAVVQHMFLPGILILTDWLDKTSNISILSCMLYTPALLPAHITVGLPQMDGAADVAICDLTSCR
jgi:hypothetical protein